MAIKRERENGKKKKHTLLKVMKRSIYTLNCNTFQLFKIGIKCLVKNRRVMGTGGGRARERERARDVWLGV